MKSSSHGWVRHALERADAAKSENQIMYAFPTGLRQMAKLWQQPFPMVGGICMQDFLWTIMQMQLLCLYLRPLKFEDPNLISHLFLNWSDWELNELKLQCLLLYLLDVWPHSVNVIPFSCRILPVCATHMTFPESPGVVRLSLQPPFSHYLLWSVTHCAWKSPESHALQHQEIYSELSKWCSSFPSRFNATLFIVW